MGRPQFNIKINVSRIEKEHLYKGKSTYLDCAVFELDNPDEYGNTHVIYQSVSKEARESGVKGKIIGNMKPLNAPQQRQQRPQQQRPTGRQTTNRPPPQSDTNDDDFEF